MSQMKLLGNILMESEICDDFRNRKTIMYKRSTILISLIVIGSACFAQDRDEIRKSIFFGGGSYSIDDIQQKDLSDWLDSIPNLLEKYEIELISHTDPIGGKRFNEWLSKMRSEAVFQLIVEKSIPPEMIHRKDWAFENPVYTNDSFQGMVMNRRVDVIIRPIVF